MKKILPYPLLFASLLLFWLLLNGFTRAQLLLGAIIALVACLIMTALQPQKNHIRSIPTMLLLFGTMSYDILQSNIAVAGIILSRKRKRRPGFVVIQLDCRSRLHNHSDAGHGLGGLQRCKARTDHPRTRSG